LRSLWSAVRKQRGTIRADLANAGKAVPFRRRGGTQLEAGGGFTGREVTLICRSLIDSLPRQEIDQRRLELLPKILREWSRVDLRHILSMASSNLIAERAKRSQMLRSRARSLLQVLNAIDQRERTAIAFEDKHTSIGQVSSVACYAEIDDARKQLEELSIFLTRLISAPMSWKRKPGQPRNVKAYLVMKDAAAIFEWVTYKRASRSVDPVTDSRSPFWRFAEAIWSAVFHQTSGLEAAMRNWDRGRKHYNERSALIANIALRHPTWGLFEEN
jgi:hypothetical protein